MTNFPNLIQKLKTLKSEKEIERQFLRNLNPLYKGQSWGGADAMVISADQETQDQYKHVTDAKLISRHTQAIGRLYRKIKNIVAKEECYDHLTKLELWGRITEAGSKSTKGKPTIPITEIVVVIVDEAIAVVQDWQTRSVGSTSHRPGGSGTINSLFTLGVTTAGD